MARCGGRNRTGGPAFPPHERRDTKELRTFINRSTEYICQLRALIDQTEREIAPRTSCSPRRVCGDRESVRREALLQILGIWGVGRGAIQKTRPRTHKPRPRPLFAQQRTGRKSKKLGELRRMLTSLILKVNLERR